MRGQVQQNRIGVGFKVEMAWNVNDDRIGIRTDRATDKWHNFSFYLLIPHALHLFCVTDDLREDGGSSEAKIKLLGQTGSRRT